MTRVNLAVNPSLRNGTTTGYTPLGGATLSVTDEHAWYGTYALLITKAAANSSGVAAAPVPVVANKPYAFSQYAWLPIAVPLEEASEIVMQVSWLNSLGVVLHTDISTTLQMTEDGVDYRLGGVWTAPAGATIAQVSVYQPLAGTAGAHIALDALLIEQANYIGGYFDNISQAEKNAIVIKALTPAPQVINGIRLGADVVLNGLVLNTIDEDDTVWVCTDIDGWWGQGEPEIPDIGRGTEDGSYDVEGRTKARTINLSGFFIPKDSEASLSKALDRLTVATALTRAGGWLHAHESPTKGAWVRLSARPTVRTVNARGRTEFRIQLRAGDPIKYHWNDQDPNGFTYAAFEAADGVGIAENIGTATVSALLTFTGPLGAGSHVFNANTDETLMLQMPLRGAGLIADAYEVESAGGVATIKTVEPHQLRVGDEVQLLNMVIPFSESDQIRTVTSVSEVYPFSFSFSITTDDIYPMSTGGQIRLVNDDVLVVDTYNRSVSYNGEVAGHRHRLTTLTDWIHLAPGNNVIEVLDDVTDIEVLNKQLTSNVVTLTTKTPHLLIAGEEIVVELPTDVPLSKKSLTSNVVTLTTSTPHGFSVGDTVDVQSTETARIVNKSRTSNVATLTTELPHGVAVSDQIVVALPTAAQPTQKQLTSNVATITTQHPHGFSVGDSVVVALPAAATVSSKKLASNVVTLTTTAPHNFSVGDSITVTMPASASVVGKARSGAQVVLTTSSAHGFASGDQVIVALPTTATMTGNLTGSNLQLVTVTTTAAHGFSVGDRITFTGLPIARWNATWVIETVPTTTTFTFRDWQATAATTGSSSGATLLNATNQSYNGTKTLVAASGTTFAYNL